ncbi:MAG: multicopper oxidase domain-containing protein [Actinomycetota bacterium]
MKKIVTIGMFFLAISLVIGVTWVGPVARSHRATAATRLPSTVAYRTDTANGTTVNVDLIAEETVQEIAPDVKYHVWTFNGTTPAPVIRVRLGDTIHFTLTNASTIGMQHSIDFHAALTPWADLPPAGSTTLTGNYQPVNPGETKTFDFVAMFPGVFMYHCGVPPVLQHIANGMYGAIIVEPDNLPAEREYVLVSSELYPGAKPIKGVYEGDMDRMLAVDPEYVVFNGVANQYTTEPLEVRPNEPFRIWVVNAGPTLTNAFHVIGTLFLETYPSGNLANPLYGLQTWGVPPGDGAMFELQIPDPGLYPFVTHSFAYTGLGAVGLIRVDPNAPEAPSAYPLMADPFSGGVTAVDATGGPSPASSSTPSPTPSSTPSSSPTATTGPCAPSGTTLQVTALNATFDTDCLAAPAGKAFTIVLDNKDPGVVHNISIYTDESATQALFTGDLLTGPGKTTYQIDALDPGTYFFRCDVHPTTMTGTFVVK